MLNNMIELTLETNPSKNKLHVDPKHIEALTEVTLPDGRCRVEVYMNSGILFYVSDSIAEIQKKDFERFKVCM